MIMMQQRGILIGVRDSHLIPFRRDSTQVPCKIPTASSFKVREAVREEEGNANTMS